MKKRMASILSVSSARSLVDRLGPGKAPTAFRIWAAGENTLDDGKIVVFSARSAEMLLKEQDARGRLYSFDYDHRSTERDVSPEAGAAAGWHRLEVRRDSAGNPELWATACDWTEAALTGLTARTPTWRYFSPTFFVDEKTGEIVSYVNCAITNNPLTHGLPSLASAAGKGLAMARARIKLLAAKARATAPVMASALERRVTNAERMQAARGKLEALTARATRVASDDGVVAEIDRANRDWMRSIGKEGRVTRSSCVSVSDIERAGRNVLRTIPGAT
ncbi:hypothetical protein AKJ09_08994 [Labilithrix luteola]|uniref:Mu-like prophage I protein n=1 Tax=Labilithrix luteola TaxID=1391654 RepID=A0A0K1Q964_9BACT|nr:phage protease [Labilithrix luteola]AKV02331.1 hypothetical protein AKJ09_08994 [Labilithrix luteola]